MNEAVIASTRQAMSEYGRLDLTAAGRENAQALFPRLAREPIPHVRDRA